jgi:hypothetical protein
MKLLTWVVVPLLVGVAAGASSKVGLAHACRPQMVFWVLEKATAQPEGSAVDAASWPGTGQLGASSIALREGQTWLDIDY